MDVDLGCLCRLCARNCYEMQNIFENSNMFATDISKEVPWLLPLKIETVTSIKVK